MNSAPPTGQNELLQRLDDIALHLKNLDRRDRTRMIWGTIRSAIGFGMFLVALFGSWYLADHFAEIMKLVVQESAKQTQEMMKSGSNDFLKQMKKMFQ